MNDVCVGDACAMYTSQGNNNKRKFLEGRLRGTRFGKLNMIVQPFMACNILPVMRNACLL
jgi:hypothetical protein